MTKKHSKNNYSDNALKTIAYIMSTYHIGTHDLDIRDVLKSYIISNTSYFDFNVDDAIYEVLTMPSRDGNPITRKQKSFINLRYQTYSNN